MLEFAAYAHSYASTTWFAVTPIVISWNCKKKQVPPSNRFGQPLVRSCQNRGRATCSVSSAATSTKLIMVFASFCQIQRAKIRARGGKIGRKGDLASYLVQRIESAVKVSRRTQDPGKVGSTDEVTIFHSCAGKRGRPPLIRHFVGLRRTVVWSCFPTSTPISLAIGSDAK